MSDTFSAIVVTQSTDGHYHTELKQRPISSLPPGELLIDVHYSSLNYKDALSASGNKGVTRQFPHTPGIDAAGVVRQSGDSRFTAGDEVIVTGFDLGMNTSGGLAQSIRVPAAWAVKKPSGISLRDTMVLGTAGLTAALCVDKLLNTGLAPNSQVLVTGATGGVGCTAVVLLSSLGYQVTAVSGKPDAKNWLAALGANHVIGRGELSDASPKPLLKPVWHAAVDSVGGEMLGNILKSIHHSGAVACCGLAAGDRFQGTVMPFILRGVSLLGVDSVEISTAQKASMWEKLATNWSNVSQALVANKAVEEITLSQCRDYLPRFLAGEIQGRIVVNCA